MIGANRSSQVDLEVERLVVGDPGMSRARAERLRGLVETEVGRLLAGSAIDLRNGSTPLIVVPPVRLPERPTDHELAADLARAIVHSLGGV
jgi:hypothetical protein